MKILFFLGVLFATLPAFANDIEIGKRLFKEKHFEKALKILEPYAHDKDPTALTLTGIIHYDGLINNAKINEELACARFESAAEQGYAQAQSRLGQCFAIGTKDLPQDREKAYLWFKKGYEGGHHKYRVFYGVAAHMAGKVEEAYHIIRPLAEIKHLDAMFILASIYADKNFSQRNPLLSCDWFEKAALAGESKAYTHLAECYLYGDGRAKDVVQAIKFFKKNDHPISIEYLEAIKDLGFKHYSKKEFREAFLILKEFKSQPFPQISKYLGFMYWLGQGTEKNQTKGCDYFEKAAAYEELEAIAYLGLCYAKKLGREEDLRHGYTLLKFAHDRGFQTYSNILASQAHFNQDYALAMEISQKLSKEGKTGFLTLIGMMYENGDGVPRNITEACDWYKKSADAGQKSGMHHYGYCLYSGEGAQQDKEKAYTYFKRAAELGWEEARPIAASIRDELKRTEEAQ